MSDLAPDKDSSKMKSKFLKSSWTIYIIFILIVGLLVLLFYPQDEGWRVKSIKDGDTIILTNGEEVRYVGIDTPEKSQPYFDEAKEINRKLVEGKRVTLEFDTEKRDDRFRLLAYVWIVADPQLGDSLLVNAELIKRGLAWVYSHRPNLKYRDYFISLQKGVRQKRIGIWSLPVSEEKYYVASKGSKKFVFHRPHCSNAKRILEKNRIIFKTRDEALDSGYSPCRTCKP
jgi:micrococcal nuclease